MPVRNQTTAPPRETAQVDPASAGLGDLLAANRVDLLRILTARGIMREEAEDLLQDLFIRLEGRPVGSIARVRPYLLRTIDNLRLDRYRTASRRAGREAAWAVAQAGSSPFADSGPSAERALIARDRLRAVSSALATLPERTLTVFHRFRIDEVRQKAIAAELGISLSAVEKHLQAAYRLLVAVRSDLDAEFDPPAAIPRDASFARREAMSPFSAKAARLRRNDANRARRKPCHAGPPTERGRHGPPLPKLARPIAPSACPA
jgi:RNA polymerase sigma factor (sigma-70 family)